MLARLIEKLEEWLTPRPTLAELEQAAILRRVRYDNARIRASQYSRAAVETANAVERELNERERKRNACPDLDFSLPPQ